MNCDWSVWSIAWIGDYEWDWNTIDTSVENWRCFHLNILTFIFDTKNDFLKILTSFIEVLNSQIIRQLQKSANVEVKLIMIELSSKNHSNCIWTKHSDIIFLHIFILPHFSSILWPINIQVIGLSKHCDKCNGSLNRTDWCGCALWHQIWPSRQSR
jgi:hypothetical protein